jgi:hypothetical protein
MVGTSVDGRRSVTRLLIASVTLATAALAIVGCSSSPDAIFPAVHDMPAPRPDAPLTADQVKAATDDLITQREHLSTEVQTAAQPAPPAKIANTKTAGTKTANAKTVPPKKPPFVPEAAPETTATVTPTAPTTPAAQTAGAYSKP